MINTLPPSSPPPPPPPPPQPSSPVISVQTTNQEPSDLPPVTTGTSEHYVHGLALAVSRASSTDPINMLFEGEKLQRPGQPAPSPAPETMMQEAVYASALGRLAFKIPHGAFVAEAAGFAAVACWEPMTVREAARWDMRDGEEEVRPLFAEFARKVEAMAERHLFPVAGRMGDGRFWHLCLMARDPGVAYVRGAVRAVLVPFMRKFASGRNEGGPVPVWLEAGSPRARDVYAHFGFREVGVIETAGIKTWGMIYTGDWTDSSDTENG